MVKEGPLGARKPHEPSRMRMYGAVTVEDVLQSLVGTTARIESSTGTQLEIARVRAAERKEAAAPQGADAVFVKGQMFDPWSAMDRAELNIGLDLAVTRCLADLCAFRWFKDANAYHLVAFQRKAPYRTKGELVVGCLRAYHEWALNSFERALASVFVWSQRTAGADADDANELAQDFRLGKRTDARKAAANLYADSLLVLSEWVRVWNRRMRRGAE